MSSTSDCPARFCDREDHAECWREYEQQENEYKYRPVKGLF